MEKRELAFNLYKESGGKKPLTEIAKEVDASSGTVRGWKSRYKWDESLGITPKEKECNAATNKRNVTRSATNDVTPNLVIDNDNLTEKEKLFCIYYLRWFNATKAYQLAYNSKYNTANAEGYKLLVKPCIKKELDRLKSEMQQEIYTDTKQLLNKLLQQANADITDFVEFGTEIERVATTEQEVTDEVDSDGMPVFKNKEVEFKYSFVRLKESAEVDGTMIQEVKKGKDGVSVRLYDGQKALIEVLKRLEVADAQSQGDSMTDWKQQVIDAANRRAKENDGK